MKQKPTENLPATTGGQTFDLSLPEDSKIELNPDLLPAIQENDFKGYVAARESLPIVSVRGKPALDESGKVIVEGGGFKIHDAVTAKLGITLEDIPGPMMVSILAAIKTRVYWPDGESGQPHCRSNDGIIGLGVGSGNCATCPLGQFGKKPDGKIKGPECSNQYDLLVYDHNLGGCVMFRVSPGGLGAYDAYTNLVKRLGTVNGQVVYPPLSWMVRITTQYEGEAGQKYHRPEFIPLSQIPLELFTKLKAVRDELKDTMLRTAEIVTENPDGKPGFGNVPVGDELPAGVDAVQTGPIPGHGQVARQPSNDDDAPF